MTSQTQQLGPEAAFVAAERARDYLLGRQSSSGWWKGELRTNVTMDAEDLLMRQFLGILEPDDLAQAARWIRSQQRADGTWANFEGGPGDLSTTVEAYVALRLAGDELDAPHVARAREWILIQGGLEATRVFTRIWLALFGEWSWDELPTMPPELIFLPKSFPLNVYQWACWARQTVVPLTVVATLRPVRPLPFSVGELRTGGIPEERRARRRLPSLARAFQLLDKALNIYQHAPWHPMRRRAMRECVEWILARQESDGGWGGIQPPWVYSVLALHLMGYPLDHPAVASAIKGLDGFLVHEETPDGPLRRLEACQSPVWDTCLALIALDDAGVPTDDPSVRLGVQWMAREEVRVTGDWAVQRPDLAPAGWAFEFANDYYPDIDDTAEVVIALNRVGDPELEGAIRRGVDWVLGMQSADGGWGAFDADNTHYFINKLPFCDFGAVIDPPSADVTAHAVEMLAVRGLADGVAAQRGVQWLLQAQETDGSWFGRWGANHIYGTGAVVPALVAAGVQTSTLPIKRAVRWLHEHQNADGGWGEDLRSYREPEWVGRGASTPSQTGWALMALLAAGDQSASVAAGISYLVSTQRPDGGWDEELFTGTGFPGDFYINYEIYRHVFPLSALGRYLSQVTR